MRALATASDPDDVVCVYLWIFAALVCQRFRRRRAARPWFNCHRRNDRSFWDCDLPDSSHVLCNRASVCRSENHRTAGTTTGQTRVSRAGPMNHRCRAGAPTCLAATETVALQVFVRPGTHTIERFLDVLD